MFAGISRLGLGCNAAVTPSPVYVLTAALGSTASDSFRISYGGKGRMSHSRAHIVVIFDRFSICFSLVSFERREVVVSNRMI